VEAGRDDGKGHSTGSAIQIGSSLLLLLFIGVVGIVEEVVEVVVVDVEVVFRRKPVDRFDEAVESKRRREEDG